MINNRIIWPKANLNQTVCSAFAPSFENWWLPDHLRLPKYALGHFPKRTQPPASLSGAPWYHENLFSPSYRYRLFISRLRQNRQNRWRITTLNMFILKMNIQIKLELHCLPNKSSRLSLRWWMARLFTVDAQFSAADSLSTGSVDHSVQDSVRFKLWFISDIDSVQATIRWNPESRLQTLFLAVC